MGLETVCGQSTQAGKRYRRRMLVTMSIYLVLVLGTAMVVRHAHLHGWILYGISLVPALPVIVMLVQMGQYLREETDEYVRMMTVRAVLMATGALLVTLVVSDFLRSFAEVSGLPPFASFVTFFLVLGIAQAVQGARSGGSSDE